MANKSPASKGIVLLLTCAAQFMVVLDIAIVNVALPSIQRDLGIGEGPEHPVAVDLKLAPVRLDQLPERAAVP